jgi:hypothetical protein
MDSGKEKEGKKTRELQSAGATILKYRTVVDVVSSSCDSSYSCLCVAWVIYTVFGSLFSRACHDIASLTIRHTVPYHTSITLKQFLSKLESLHVLMYTRCLLFYCFLLLYFVFFLSISHNFVRIHTLSVYFYFLNFFIFIK